MLKDKIFADLPTVGSILRSPISDNPLVGTYPGTSSFSRPPSLPLVALCFAFSLNPWSLVFPIDFLCFSNITPHCFFFFALCCSFLFFYLEFVLFLFFCIVIFVFDFDLCPTVGLDTLAVIVSLCNCLGFGQSCFFALSLIKTSKMISYSSLYYSFILLSYANNNNNNK